MIPPHSRIVLFDCFRLFLTNIPTIASGTNVQTHTFNGSAAQQWYVTNLGGGEYRIMSNLNRSYSLDVNGWNNANGTNVQIWQSTTDRFRIRRNNGGDYPNGVSTTNKYVITPTFSGSRALDVYYGSDSSKYNINVQLYSYSYSANQMWIFEKITRAPVYHNSIHNFDGTYAGREWVTSTLESLFNHYGYNNITYGEKYLSKASALSQLQQSSIWTIRSHGNTNVVALVSSGNKREDITSSDISNLLGNALYKNRLVIFAACNTALGRRGAENISSAAYKKGADTVIGFKTEIDKNCANTWIKEFFTAAFDKKMNIEDACDRAVSQTALQHLKSGGVELYEIYGKYVRLLTNDY